MIARSTLTLLLILALPGAGRADLISDGTNVYGGDGAFSSNIDGTHATAIGVGAMLFTKHGADNTAVGHAALPGLMSGNRNTAIGEGSGAAAGDDNTASGSNALFLGIGNQNTADGSSSLGGNPQRSGESAGSDNTATGYEALGLNTSGSNNTAAGAMALLGNTTGNLNTAVGFEALMSSTASNNTAVGAQALQEDTSGAFNAATGTQALQNNTTGSSNTASGFDALLSNIAGNSNTADGDEALLNNTTGSNNTAIGDSSLISNQTGQRNTAIGAGALGDSNATGNTAVGFAALSNSSDGSNLIAIGSGAGQKLTSGNDDIYIGNKGKDAESDTIRLGSAQTQTFIAGINVTPVSGSTVLINKKGQLGILASSARYKRDIEPMASSSERLLDLRPVTFRYKSDPTNELQYGLVAEEVARTYPELVVRSDDGQVQSVKYEELIPMLLNEVQRQRDVLAQMKAREDAQRATDEELAARLTRLEESAALGTIASR